MTNVGGNIGQDIVKIQSRPESDQVMSNWNYSVWEGGWKGVIMRHSNELFQKDRVIYANAVKGVWVED